MVRYFKIGMTLLIFLMFGEVQSQSKQEVIIKTSAQCEMCKEKIVSHINMQKGVKKASLNLESGELVVLYNNQKTSDEKLRKEVTSLGYDADDLSGDPKKYEALPMCCKKPQE